MFLLPVFPEGLACLCAHQVLTKHRVSGWLWEAGSGPSLAAWRVAASWGLGPGREGMTGPLVESVGAKWLLAVQASLLFSGRGSLKPSGGAGKLNGLGRTHKSYRIP